MKLATIAFATALLGGAALAQAQCLPATTTLLSAR